MRRDNVPANDNDLLSFATNISTRLTATPVPFGVTAAMATQLASLLSAFNTKLAAAQNPETRGHSTVFAKDTAKMSLVTYLRTVIRQVQGTSTVTDQQRTDLGITVRKIPSPPANPGTPDKFKAELDALGRLLLSWKCTNPTGGTMYQIFRQIDGGETSYLGGAGGKKFVDATVPAGAAKVTYQIQAQRSTAAGAWATFEVKFGVGAGGSAVESVKQSPVKIAA